MLGIRTGLDFLIITVLIFIITYCTIIFKCEFENRIKSDLLIFWYKPSTGECARTCVIQLSYFHPSNETFRVEIRTNFRREDDLMLIVESVLCKSYLGF